MTFQEISPSLEDMGSTLWGDCWHEYLALALDVNEDEIDLWETEPTRRPADLEDKLQRIGLIRIEEIAYMIGRLKDLGLRGPVAGPES